MVHIYHTGLSYIGARNTHVYDFSTCTLTQVGGLCGHQAGVTCITAKGDGHHFISNGKDQTMKLWDIRKMLDPNDSKMAKAANIPHWCAPRHSPRGNGRG